jgi:hypothetical protein
VEHAQFVDAWRRREIQVVIDPPAAAAFVSARLLLPFVAIAVIGAGIAVVLIGWIWSGLALGALGIIGPRLIKRSAGGFLLQHIADDPALYADALRAGVLSIVAVDPPRSAESN